MLNILTFLWNGSIYFKNNSITTMQNKYFREICESLSAALQSSSDIKNFNIEPSSKFMDIPGFDSMSAVNFQMELADRIGEKANDAAPLMDMTLETYSDLLDS